MAKLRSEWNYDSKVRKMNRIGLDDDNRMLHGELVASYLAKIRKPDLTTPGSRHNQFSFSMR